MPVGRKSHRRDQPPEADDGLSKRLRQHQSQVRAGTFKLPGGKEVESHKPGKALVVSDAQSLVLAGIGYGLLVLIMASGLWTQFFHLVVPMDSLRTLSKTGIGGFPLTFGVILSGVILGFLGWTFARRRQAHRRTTSTTGLLLKAWMHTQTSSRVSVGAVALTYEYEVAKKVRLLVHFPFGTVHHNTWEKHERNLKRFTPGDTVQVLVDPNDGRNAGLRPQDCERVVWVLFGLLSAPVAAAIGFGTALLIV